jgi:hypothetical protein
LLRGQSGSPINVQVAQVESDSAIVVLDTCFPFCDVPPPPPPPPPVSFSGGINESSAPDMGTGYNGGVAGAIVILSGSASGVISLTTNASGNYSGIYQPPSEPTVYATKYGVSNSSCCVGTPIYLYTDVVTKLRLTPNSAPAADGAAVGIVGTVNGAAGSTTKALYTGFATPILIPRQPGSSTSSISVTGIDSPRFTWFGESPIALSQSGPTGGYASGEMLVRAMHKYIKVVLQFQPPSGLPIPTDTKLFSYDWNAVSYPPNLQPIYSAAGLFGLPTAYDAASAPVSQANPSAPGTTQEYVFAANRLGTAGAPYKSQFKLHVDSRQMQSDWTSGNEDIIIDDAARVSGVIYKSMRLTLKDIAK